MEHRTLAGVIFDLDGTLLDSTAVWSQIDRIILQEHGIQPPAGLSDLVKKLSIAESSQYFITQFGLPYTPESFSQHVQELAAEQYQTTLPLKPHALELLNDLDQKQIPYCVVTANYRTLAQAALERLGLMERIAFLLTEQEAGATKTSPEIFRWAAAAMHLGRRQLVVAEDSLHCIETAKQAGFFTVGVYDAETAPEEWTKIQATATISVSDLQEMKTLF